MSIAVIQLGSPRKAKEGLRLGTVRRPPRGVPKSQFAKRDFYDIWMPDLSPSAPLVKEALKSRDQSSFTRFERKFRHEMSAAHASRLLDLLAALSHQTNMSIGCYCEDESRCHRSILRQLLVERGADVD